MRPDNCKIALIHTGDPGNSAWERSLRVLGHGGGNTALGWVGAKAVGTPPPRRWRRCARWFCQSPWLRATLTRGL